MTEPGEQIAAKGSNNTHPDTNLIRLLARRVVGQSAFQLDHETAKLIGAPPGYPGHHETVPMLTQQALKNATIPMSDLQLVLFDEIEEVVNLIRGLFYEVRAAVN